MELRQEVLRRRVTLLCSCEATIVAVYMAVCAQLPDRQPTFLMASTAWDGRRGGALSRSRRGLGSYTSISGWPCVPRCGVTVRSQNICIQSGYYV